MKVILLFKMFCYGTEWKCVLQNIKISFSTIFNYWFYSQPFFISHYLKEVPKKKDEDGLNLKTPGPKPHPSWVYRYQLTQEERNEVTLKGPCH